jgi:uncharacterized spore protein YtfJ
VEEGSEQRESRKPFRIETVRGEPYRVGGRTLVPEARVVTFGRARATIGSRQVGGWNGAYVQVTPTAIIEETPDGERRIPMVSATAQATRSLAAIGIAVVLVLTLVQLIARILRGAR